MPLILPEHYESGLSLRETHEAIKYIRDTFQKEFAKQMNLSRISAPLFVEKSTGLMILSAYGSFLIKCFILIRAGV